ncbi:Athe_2463 domain-containing protein [Paenibacillus sp. sgz302251]|uniref:Athe_2463 domain-containing protein n=1 Tax=Paenibacillus sp. sgz302251 TaxID=3414493 RepID=UPI003C7D8ACC
MKKNLLLVLTLVLLISSIPIHKEINAAGRADCGMPGTFTEAENLKAQKLIEQNDIPTTNGSKELNIGFLLNKCNIGKATVVYGSPLEVERLSGNDFNAGVGQWRYLGWDETGSLFRNWMFPSDSRATLHVAKNWVKEPWKEVTGFLKGIDPSFALSSNPAAAGWLEKMVDPYKESATFLESYNKRKDPNWTGDTLLDYAIIQQRPTDFSPGVVQMWNIWQPDGSWWYEMFIIPPLKKIEIKEEPDLIIKTIVNAPDALVGDSVPVKITTENRGQENSGPFTVGIVGTNIKSEVITNLPPNQIKTVTVNVTSNTTGIKSFIAMTDFGLAVKESNEDNNTKPFQIAFNRKNEPTSPIAIISHFDGDHRTEPEITIQPLSDPQLNDELSYSPGGEAITVKEWQYTPPEGTLSTGKPSMTDFVQTGDYLIKLRVMNSANRWSEWAQLKIKVEPEVVILPDPAIRLDIEFDPPRIITGEKSSLKNNSDGVETHSWVFSGNLEDVLSNRTDFAYPDITFTEPGIYRAEFTGYNGALTGKETAYLEVIDPKPVAVVTGITRVIQGRDFPFPHHLLNSYTPLADRGVTIDFTKSEIRHKLISNHTYTAAWPDKAPMELGKYSIEGKVHDSEGRISEWGTLQMEVVPDLPPTLTVIAPEEAYRNSFLTLYMQADSPDGDILQHLLLEERYDQDDDGNFDEEAWTTLYDGDFKWTHKIENYPTVGKRQYKATVTEHYGQQGNSPPVVTNILNHAPQTNFNVSGVIQQPDQGEDSAPPITAYTPESIFRSWTAKKPYIGGTASKIGWKADSNAISTKNAILADFKISYPNMGQGSNARSLYDQASDLTPQNLWRSPDKLIEAVFAGHRMYTISESTASDTITERNAVTGAANRSFVINKEGYTYRQIDKKENFYYFLSTASSLEVKVINKNGESTQTHTLPFSSNPGLRYSEVSADGRYLYVIASIRIDSYIQLLFVKYDLLNRAVVWNSPGALEVYAPLFYEQLKATINTNGDLVASYSATEGVYGPDTGWVVRARNNGVISYIDIGGATDVSYPVVSNDGQFIYVATSAQSSNNKRFSSKLTTIRTTDTSLSLHRSANMETWDAGSLLFDNDDRFGIATPIVRPDGSVYATTKVNYGDYLFNHEGSPIQGQNTNGNKAGNYRLYQLPNGRIAFPTMGFYDNGNLYAALTSTVWAGGTSTNYIRTVVSKTYPNTSGGGWSNSTNMTSSSILPDGSLYFFYRVNNNNTVVPFVSPTALNGTSSVYPKVIDPESVEIVDDHWAGLLYDAGSVMKNYNFEFDVSVNNLENAKTIGTALNIQNEKNMYSVEWEKNKLILFRVVNGLKTELKSITQPRASFTPYTVKVESVNGTLRVFINNVKKLEAVDTTFLKGAAGIMSLGQPQATFSKVKKNNYGDTYTEEVYESVLVNDPVLYDKIFKDIESDLMAAEQWSYSHNPNFFENPEGLSMYHGQSFSSTINALEKPGVYSITFKAEDNPGLPAYRKWSEPVEKLLYVHRRPVAMPDVRFTGRVFAEGEALDYETHDASYDPDIAHILSDRLFRTRWADETTWTTGKRQFYNRPGVELIVQEQVRDIHGAWSYWGQSIVYKDSLPPINQIKPVMTITYPGGTTATTPTVLIKEPTITWTYADAENDPQEMYRLTFTYVDTNEIALHIEHEGAALNYAMLPNSIVPGRVVRVQGQVYSKGVWSNLSNIRYFLINRAPNTHLLSYNGLDATNPIYTNSNRPLLRVFTIDPENHPITAIDYEVYRAVDGAMAADTNTATALASYAPSALAEGLHYWRARAADRFAWGPYSSNGFFFVDTIKPADVVEQLEIEPTAVKVTFNAFSDAAPSSGHASRTFYLQKVNTNGSVTNIDLNGDGSAEYSVPLALTRQSYRVTGLIPGQQYRLTILDDDIAGNEGSYAYIYFYTNRPPTADFDWLPMPIYEGDTVTFTSEVDDPDGSTVAVTYELTNPAGVKKSFSYTLNGPDYPVRGPSLRMSETGIWSMRLTVSDGIADPVVVTKSVQVRSLGVAGYVMHTELWDQHRKAYNLKTSGDENSPRGFSVFWAGEKFVLVADTTLTGTATKADRVEVQMGAYTASLVPASSSKTSWSGELWDASFTQLARGRLTFTFTAYYNNGTVRTVIAEVTIDGQTLEIVGVHRVQ